MATGTSAVRASGELLEIKLTEIQESKTNPRKHFAKDTLQDLTKSIAEKGVLDPLLVRRTPGVAAALIGYEIIAGARRFRAAKAAGLESVPVVVRDVTDMEALEIQVIENLQRQDVHPLEEAEGYKQLLAKGKYDVDALAAKVGKSVSYVYQRLKLAELVPAAKKAFEEEQITAGHAILLARLQPKDQSEILKENRADDGLDLGSVRNLADTIKRNYHLELSRAIFPIDSKELVPAAGSCMDCPKRTGFNQALFADVNQKDICTDGKCFHEKETAFVRTQLGTHPDAVMLSLGHSYKDQTKGRPHHEWKPAGKQQCPDTGEGVIVQWLGQAESYGDKKGLVLGQVLQVCINPSKCKVHGARDEYSCYTSGGGRPESEKRRERARKQELDRRGRVFRAMVEAGKMSVSQTEERAILTWAVKQIDHDTARQMCYALAIKAAKEYGSYDFRGALESRIKGIGAKAVSAWLLYCVIGAHDLFYGAYLSGAPKPQLLETAARARGVNVKAITKKVRAEAAAKAKKKGKSKAKAKKPAKSHTSAKAKKTKKAA